MPKNQVIPGLVKEKGELCATVADIEKANAFSKVAFAKRRGKNSLLL